jgi:hypothetical protein
MNKLLEILILAFLVAQTVWADSVKTEPFNHARWDRLLSVYVQPINGGAATAVDYQGMKADQLELKQYLTALSRVSQAQFDHWSKQNQLAFLINAYNAWTVELILIAWPDVKSIKELGSFFSSPWSKEFVSLLGKTRTLDDIEHGLIRGSGRYNDPRIHFAVNCASIGCPALRAEAYVGDKLDQQLDKQTSLFLTDRSRNRVEGDIVKLSSIFKWYREDFEKGWRGFNRLEDFMLAHGEALGLPESMVTKLNNGKANIEFLDYDWRLNKK